MVTSTNQNRQIYVLDSEHTGKVKTGKDGIVFATYKGAETYLRSDLIDPKTVTHVRLADQSNGEDKLIVKKLSFSDTATHPIVGQDYIVRINFYQFYGMSDEDIYQKYGAVHATSAMTGNNATKFWQEMLYSLVKNFSKTYADYLHFYTTASADNRVDVAKKVGGVVTLYHRTDEGTLTDITSTVTTDGIYIAEASQVAEWHLGKGLPMRVRFEVIPTTVYSVSDNAEIPWGSVDDATTDFASVEGMVIPNSYKFAELEWFLMGERGDQYRQLWWPKNIDTKYLVDPTADKGYYSLDIHYAYQGTCEDIQKSEKDILIISTDNTTLKAIAKELKDAGVPEAVITEVKADGSVDKLDTTGE